MPIEDWISDPIASERHERVEASPERALELAFEDFIRENDFFFLRREPREAVIGLARPVWTPRGGDRGAHLTDPAGWEEWNEPRSFKVR